MDYPRVATGTKHSIFDVVAWPARERGGGGSGGCRAILRVEQRQPTLVPFRELHDAFARRKSEDTAGLVRESHVAGIQVTIPVADVRDSLSVVEAALALAQTA